MHIYEVLTTLKLFCIASQTENCYPAFTWDPPGTVVVWWSPTTCSTWLINKYMCQEERHHNYFIYSFSMLKSFFSLSIDVFFSTLQLSILLSCWNIGYSTFNYSLCQVPSSERELYYTLRLGLENIPFIRIWELWVSHVFASRIFFCVKENVSKCKYHWGSYLHVIRLQTSQTWIDCKLFISNRYNPVLMSKWPLGLFNKTRWSFRTW